MLLNVQREMKILTWNINGIRAARRGKPLKEVLDSLEADVICLQETKVTRDMLDEVTAIVDGYNAYFSFSKVKTGYSGVATFCRDAVTPVAAEEGLSSSLTSQPSIGCYGSNSDFTVDELEALDAEGRAILTEHRFPDGKNVVIINVYCPRADKENKDRVNFKLRFYKLLQERAESLVKAERHVIVLGDINTAHKMIDHCEPDEEKTFNTNPGRQWLNQFLVPSDESCNTVEDTHELLQTTEKLFIDTFRWFHPTQCGAYTNWCTVTSARQTNYGTRIDYIFADVELVKKELIDCVIRPDIDGSDHCPVIAILKTSFQGASKPPAPCTKYMPEFAGKQQKLKSYFVKHSEQAQSSSQPNSNSVTSKSQEGTSMKRSASFGDEKSKVKRQKTGVKTKADSQPKTNLFSFFSRPSNSVSSQRKAPDLNSENGCENIHVSHVTSKTMHPNKSSSTLETGISASVDRTTSFTDENLRESNTSKPAHTNKDSMTLESDNSASDECTTSFIEEVAPSNTTMTSKDCPQKRKAEAALWKSILTGPRPPPLCSSHKEPCALRTVKAKGPNQGKQFYCCARPQGHSSNPQVKKSLLRLSKDPNSKA